MNEIIPTIVPESFADLSAKASVLSGFSQSLHIDAADGVFAPNLTWLPSGEKLPDADRIFYEAHLMLSDPHQKGVDFAQAGAKRIIGHAEAFSGAEAVFAAFDAWHEAGAIETGMALLLDTPLEAIRPYLVRCDVAHVMTIGRIGTQGIPFDERSLIRIQELHRAYPSLMISVDGGENEESIVKTARAGARRFAVGSAFTAAADPRAVYTRLVETANAV